MRSHAPNLEFSKLNISETIKDRATKFGMWFLLMKSNLYANFYKIWTKSKKVGVANFCANLMLKFFFEKSLEPKVTKKIKLVPCLYLIQFKRY